MGFEIIHNKRGVQAQPKSPCNIIDKEFKDICCDAKENKIIKKNKTKQKKMFLISFENFKN